MTTSIIIPTHNGLAHLRPCIESIRRFTANDAYDLIIVDNASDDGTSDWLLRQPDLTTITLGSNVGFPGACNQGLAAASGDFLLLLNDDTLVTPRWLEQLTAALSSHPSIGAVGPVTNAASYFTQVPVSYRTTEEMIAFAEQYNVSDPAKWERRLKLIGFCLLMKREVYEQIGSLDERFAPGNYEDDDYCLRMHLAGWGLRLCTDTFIHHEGTATFRKDMGAYSAVIHRNTVKFIEKWGFHPLAMQIRSDFIAWINEPPDQPLRILELECACGATLMELKDRYPNAEIFGIERHHEAAGIAALFAAVTLGDSEQVNFAEPYSSFDYVLLGDSLSYRAEPVNFLRKYIPYLKDDGKLIARVPNASYHKVIRNLLKGVWGGSEDTTPQRAFTLDSITRVFRDSGFFHLEYQGQSPPESLAPRDEHWVQEMARREGQVMEQQWKSSHFLVKGHRTRLQPGVAHPPEYPRLKRLLRRLEWEVMPQETRAEIAALFSSKAVCRLDAARILERDIVDRTGVAAKLADIGVETGVVDNAAQGIHELLEVMSDEN